MLDDMPDPCDLHLERAAGRCAVMVGSAVLAEYAESDVVMRNFAVTTARLAGFGGTRVAEVFGLSAPYVSTLHAAALRDGSQALVKQPGPGRPRTLEGEALERARQWRAAGVSDREIGRRLGMAGTTAGRRLGPRGAEAAVPEGRQGEAAGCEPLVSVEEAAGAAGNDPGCAAEPAPAPEAAADAGLVPGPEAVPGPPGVPPAPAAAAAVPPGGGAGAAGGGAGGGLVPGAGGAVAEGRVRSRYAGAMLLHAFGARAGARNVLAGAAGGQPAAARLLAAVSACFALGYATTEQFKHLAAAEAGPLAGLVALPDLRTLRPALAAIADRTDPLGLQRMFAAAMLAADPVTSGVYYVDDHFVPYAGAKPVGKGWNNKRGRAEKGRADTHVTAHDGRAVCFVTGEPSGLSVTLPKALAELKKAVPAGARDHGRLRPRRRLPAGLHALPRAAGALGDLPAGAAGRPGHAPGHHRRHRRRQDPDRSPGPRRKCSSRTTAKPGSSPCSSTAGRAADPHLRLRCVPGGHPGLAEVPVAGRELPQVRQRELRHRQDLRLRRRASSRTPRSPPTRPARRRTPRSATPEKELAAAERALAALLADPDTTAAAKNKAIPAASRAISTAKKNVKDAIAARDKIPAKLPADQIDPGARIAVLRAGRRGLQMVLRLLAHNAEHWLSSQLNAYLRDDDEYRAITRETIIRGLAGTITFTPAAITVTLEPPGHPASPAPSPCSSTRSTTPRPSSPATTGPSPTASRTARI